MKSLAKLLFQHPEFARFINFDATDSEGNTLLMLATMYMYPDVVRELLKRGDMDVNAQNHNGHTALVFSILTHRYDTATLLIEHGADINLGSVNTKPLFSAIKTAVRTGDASFVHTLLELGADTTVRYYLTNEQYVTPLEFLLSMPNTDPEDSPMILEMAAVLIEKGAHIGIAGELALRRAAEFGLVGFMELLLKNGVPANLVSLVGYESIDGSTALHHAAENGYTEAVQLLLRYGADLRYQRAELDESNPSMCHVMFYTALELAEDNGHDDTAHVLRMALLRSRVRTYGRVLGYFLRIFKQVVEVRYMPGGPGYAESLEHFESMCDEQSQSRV